MALHAVGCEMMCGLQTRRVSNRFLQCKSLVYVRHIIKQNDARLVPIKGMFESLLCRTEGMDEENEVDLHSLLKGTVDLSCMSD